MPRYGLLTRTSASALTQRNEDFCYRQKLRYAHRLPLILAVALSSGCTSNSVVIDSDGPLVRKDSFQYVQFRASFDRADLLALQVARAESSPDNRDVQAAYTQMVIDGVGLADANCADFFRSAGESQRWSMLARDIFAAIGTLATAASAAANASTGLTTGFSIATATGYNALDIYQRNFLFGADNIDSVRTLVENALAAHTDATLTLAKKQGWTGFGSAASSIMDHQAICFPASILLLSRNAIKNATLLPVSGGGTKVSVSVAPSSGFVKTTANSLNGVTAVPNIPSARHPPIVVPGRPLTTAPVKDVLVKVNSLKNLVKGLAAKNDLAALSSLAISLKLPALAELAVLRDTIIAQIGSMTDSADPDTAHAQLDIVVKAFQSAGIHVPF